MHHNDEGCEFVLKLHEHPQRRNIASEMHTHPYPHLPTPGRISHLAYLNHHCNLAHELWLFGQLAHHYSLEPPSPSASYFSLDLGHCRVLWMRYSEFSSFSVSAPQVDGAEGFLRPALAELPSEWLAQLPSNVLVAIHALVLPYAQLPAGLPDLAHLYFAGQELAGAAIGEGAGHLYSDFKADENGFVHYVLADRFMGRRQAGRMLQRLFDIESYRTLAMLAPPLAGQLAPELAVADRELAELTRSISHAREQDEPILLDRLTQLSARIESALSQTDYRFSASHAYYEIVLRRLDELREHRIQGLQPLKQFITRRLTPAMEHCNVVARRQRELAERVSRATLLLRTRVDVTLEQQNQRILSSMSEHAQLQLRLQQTVEGLSVAAISYYIISLLAYGLKGLKAAGWHLNVELLLGLAIPVVALGILAGLRVMRQHLAPKTQHG
ncbi:DUF3422 domain-containing protein [Chitinibacter fontanus]|uniref:DUF3422 domain-containing protein n=1 Tax=Chitinibacter fontanus TaxID=1737446 RepID=A0A7D5VBS3_9NEIS|nr:DUF3422 domain-containing protein [Chitinibacter fontanus]QLI82916.1 DUF3422 domain-containing protein [Chitinibacter fontanus]